MKTTNRETIHAGMGCRSFSWEKSIKKLKTMFLLLIAAFLLIAAGPQAQAAEPVKVDFVTLQALSGPAAPWGIPLLRGLELAAEEINSGGGFIVNGKTYEWNLKAYDHKYVPAEAVKAANMAIYSDRAKFMSIMGGSTTLACLSLLKENNILALNFDTGGKQVTNPDNPLIFRYNASVESMYLSVLPYLVEKEGIRTMISINPDDQAGQQGLESAKLGADRVNIKIIASEFVERGSKDYSSVLTRIIAKKPDMIETGQLDPTGSALMLKQARELGYKGVIMLSWGADTEQVMKIAGPYVEKAYMNLSGPIKPENDYQKRVYDAYSQKWGEKNWNNVTWVSYGLLPAVTKAIVTAQSFEPEAIAKELERIEWETPTGKLSFGGSKLFGIKRMLLYRTALYQFRNRIPTFMGNLEVPPNALD